MHEPGTRFAYNDVRTNLLSLALDARPRPRPGDVLRERVMEPIGAGARLELARAAPDAHGRRRGGEVPVVTGGSHWGGGLWASARDLARFGLLHLREGEWEGAGCSRASGAG